MQEGEASERKAKRKENQEEQQKKKSDKEWKKKRRKMTKREQLELETVHRQQQKRKEEEKLPRFPTRELFDHEWAQRHSKPGEKWSREVFWREERKAINWADSLHSLVLAAKRCLLWGKSKAKEKNLNWQQWRKAAKKDLDWVK